VRRQSPARVGERGFTLIEVLVSLALLSIVGILVGVIFSVGMRSLLAPGASQDRLAAASQTITVQQLLSGDVDRATCIGYLPSASGGWGNCDTARPFGGNCALSGAAVESVLCLTWPDLTRTGECSVVVYQISPGRVSRSEWLGGIAAGSTAYPVEASIHPQLDYWPVDLEVSLTSADAHLANPPVVAFDPRPLATQPWGPVISGAGSAPAC
jgi:prepilin-type N-terminal cleavage/methylation domain-containing protein